MASQKAREIADRAFDAIMFHRDSVPGRDSDSPHLYHHDRTETDDSITIRFWSEQGIFHDCWFTAEIERDGSVSFDHCGDDGMDELEGLVLSEV